MRVNENYLECNAAQQVSDPASIFMFWQQLLQLRKQYKDVLVYGQFKLIEQESQEVFCYQRLSQDATVTVILNFTENLTRWTPPLLVSLALKNGRELLANYSCSKSLSEQKLCLRPFEALVLIESQHKSRL